MISSEIFRLVDRDGTPLKVRLSLAFYNDPAMRAKYQYQQALNKIAPAAYDANFTSGREQKRAQRRLATWAGRIGTSEETANEIRSLITRVSDVEARLQTQGYGVDARREQLRILPAILLSLIFVVTCTVQTIRYHEVVDAILFGAVTVFLLVTTAGGAAWSDGFRRAIWLGALDAIQAERQAFALDVRRRAEAEAPCDLTIILPRQIPGEGFLYVIQFGTGAVKVGMTEDPRRRIGEHRRDAEAFKVAITNFWLSPAHWNFRDTEVSLINRCAEVSSRARREYFHEITFSAAVSIAASLPYYTEHGLGDSYV